MKKPSDAGIKSLHEESPGEFEDFHLEKGKDEPLEEPTHARASIEEMRIKRLQEKKEPELLSLGEGVTGVGIGLDNLGKPVLTVYVKRKRKSLMQKIQDALEGEPVVIEETGDIIAQ